MLKLFQKGVVNLDFNQLASTLDTDIRIKRAQAVSIEIESYIGHGPLEVMEFGCGTGLISLNLKKKISEGLMVDSSSKMIKELEQKLVDQNITNIQTYTGDILESDFDRKFDIIYSSMVMHHIKDFQSVIKKLVSYLKTNGKLITRACRVKEGYCVDLRIFLTVEPLLAAYKITMFFCLRLVGVP